jgi:hypothetical protein
MEPRRCRPTPAAEQARLLDVVDLYLRQARPSKATQGPVNGSSMTEAARDVCQHLLLSRLAQATLVIHASPHPGANFSILRLATPKSGEVRANLGMTSAVRLDHVDDHAASAPRAVSVGLHHLAGLTLCDPCLEVCLLATWQFAAESLGTRHFEAAAKAGVATGE